MFCAFLMQAQEKYAVLITGDYASYNFINRQNINIWNGGFDRAAMEEFWNDTFLMWEMLVDEFGYNPENVFVLFADGVDYSNAGSRYKKYDDNNQYVNIVYDEASTISVENIFTDLRYGTNGRPQITDDDFLFVWTFDHGYYSSGKSYLCLLDGNMSDEDFADLVNPIPAYKKVFWMQQCNSGGFADNLENYNVYFSSAAQYNQSAYRADNRTINNNTVEENELVNNRTYYHGEYDFHMYSSTRGESPNFVNNYYGISYTNADVNNDNIISVTEAHDWNENYNSRANETSVESDLGEIGDYTSLKYPTILYENITSNKTYKSLIAVTKDITITDGNTLKLDENSITYIINNSTLTVSNNSKIECLGTLIIEGGSQLIIEGGGQLIIEDGGQLIYEQGTTISLSGDNSHIEIAGDLFIAPNAQFTFTGNGYIKFSNPGPDYTYNITAGTGASMLFSGNGQSDKVLEIQQNTVRFPNLTSLTFENCKIEMGYEKRMQADHSYPVTFNNVKVTSTTGAHNNHRSFLFIGQSNVTINNSIFEYGCYGLYGNLTWADGAALFITNSTFRRNTQGINIYGKGLNLTNCNVVNNTNYGIYCDGMSFVSDFTDCNISNNGSGIYYLGSNGAHINTYNTYIQSNTTNGLRTNGAFNVNMVCNFINGNRYGVRTANGTNIKPHMCDLSNNFITIYLNYGITDLYDKYNQLQATNDYYTLYGWVPTLFPIRVTRNRWESNPNATPVYLDNYYLREYPPSNPNVPVNYLIGNPPAYLLCLQPKSPQDFLSENILEETTNNNLPTVTISEQTMPLDEAVSYLQQQSKNINSETAFLTIIEEYSNLISSCNTWTDSNNYSEIKLYMSIAYGDLHSIISDFYTFVNHDKANQSFINGIEKIILLNENLVTNPNLSYTDYYEYSLDIPLLYRIIGNYDDAISYLENLLYDFSDEQNKSEMEHIQTWLCKINAEKTASEGLLNIDEFFIAIEDCENCYSTKKSQGNDIELDDEFYDNSFSDKELLKEAASLEIIPNPNQGNFKINLLTSSDNCEIHIINSVGQTVKRLTSIKEGLNEINITGLKIGYYKVVYIQDNKIIDTQTVVVK